MKKYTVWCRYSKAAGEIPNERDREWNLVPAAFREVESYQWGYDTEKQALARAQAFVQYWQPGFMLTVVREVELPDYE